MICNGLEHDNITLRIFSIEKSYFPVYPTIQPFPDVAEPFDFLTFCLLKELDVFLSSMTRCRVLLEYETLAIGLVFHPRYHFLR